MKEKISIYWSRRDFRLRDNRALKNAVLNSKKESSKFLPVFIIEPYMTNGDPAQQFGYPSRYFISKAIPLFAEHFKSFLLVHDKPVKFFTKLSKDYDIEIYVNEDVHPDFYTQIKKIKDRNISIKLFRDQLTVSKDTLTANGDMYSVFTPFKKSVWHSFVNEQEDKTPSLSEIDFFNIKNFKFKYLNPLESQQILKIFNNNESILIGKEIINLKDLHIPKRNLDLYYFSEKDALNHLKKFIKERLTKYNDNRNHLDINGTSLMSLALSWGLVSSRTIISLIKTTYDNKFENFSSLKKEDQGPLQFISELIWREFYKYLLFHKPNLLDKPFQKKYENINWIEEKEAKRRFKLWIQGKTGYSIVDAAMHEIAQTGYMHNRARMIVASILTKNLGVNWIWGQEYFRAMLIDLDEASNNGGWQWGASIGADPKPIRIFNPYLQAKNYDAENQYQKKWLNDDYFNNPPELIIEHSLAREDALKRYGLSKKESARDY